MRELRRKRGLTLERLAEKANIDVKYLGEIERGEQNPTVAVLEKLATALSVRINQILTFEHALQGERALRRRLVRILERCDEKDLQMILKTVVAVKDWRNKP